MNLCIKTRDILTGHERTFVNLCQRSSEFLAIYLILTPFRPIRRLAEMNLLTDELALVYLKYASSSEVNSNQGWELKRCNVLAFKLDRRIHNKAGFRDPRARRLGTASSATKFCKWPSLTTY